MDANVKWRGKMSFTGSADTGFEVPLDAHPFVGGDNGGFRPLELMAISLAGCTAMDVTSIMKKKRQDVTGFEVNVHTENSDVHPKVFTEAVIEYVVTGRNIKEKDVVRSIELSATSYCPAQSMLAKAFPIKLRYQIFEEKEGGEVALVVSGQWVNESGHSV
jgi:putative redox protein